MDRGEVLAGTAHIGQVLLGPVSNRFEWFGDRLATIAPYALTKALLPVLGAQSRVVNLSSAAQAPVDADALARGSLWEWALRHLEYRLAATGTISLGAAPTDVGSDAAVEAVGTLATSQLIIRAVAVQYIVASVAFEEIVVV